MVSRPVLGLDLLINSDISIGLEFGRDMYQSEASTVSLSVNLRDLQKAFK